MICLLTDIPFDALLTLLSYCEPLTILLGISRLSHHMRVVCLSSDALWKEQCHHLGISQKLFKEVSWISNYKYYTLHLLRAPAVLNRKYMRRCCNRNETINLLVISGVGDGREKVLQSQAEPYYSINIRSQFSNNTGLVRKELCFDGRNYHIMSFYFHLLLSFPNFFPSFPFFESHRDVVLWIIDASRQDQPILFGPDNVLANILYNDRYYHYTRKCLHLLLSGIAPWIPLIIVVTNQGRPESKKNIEIIKELRLWKEHRLWRIYSLENTQESICSLYTQCANEVHRIRYRLASGSI